MCALKMQKKKEEKKHKEKKKRLIALITIRIFFVSLFINISCADKSMLLLLDCFCMFVYFVYLQFMFVRLLFIFFIPEI
jgi:Co/Zn/Cd efflux system component